MKGAVAVVGGVDIKASVCVCAHVFVVGLMAGRDEATATGLSLHIPLRFAADKSNRSIHPSRSYYLLKRCQSISLSLSLSPPQSVTHSVTHPLHDKSTVCVGSHYT